MKRLIFSLMTIAGLCLGLSSCSDDSEPAIDYQQNIVTYAGNEGDNCRFTYQAIDDSPLINLIAENINVMEDSTLGQYPGVRVFITYSFVGAPLPDRSGVIRLYSLVKVYQDTVSAVQSVPTDFTEPYQVQTLTRSGKYLNLMAIVPEMKFADRSFELVADESTLGDDYPQLYLCMSTKPDAIKGNDIRAIGSFDMSPVWNLATAKGVEVHVSGEGNPAVTLFKFSK